MAKKKNAQAWAEAKKRCRLNAADIQMAKELGMTPKSLMKNIPAPNQQWKAPVKVWIRSLYEKKFGSALKNQPVSGSKVKRKEKEATSEYIIDDEDLPF